MMLRTLFGFALLVAGNAAQDTTAANPWCTADAGGQVLVRGSACYEFVDIEMTWVDARRHCRQSNRQLVGVSGPDLQQWLATSAARLLPTRQGVWIGLNDRQEEGRYVWDSSNGPVQRAQYFNWKKGEPNDGGIGQDCVYMRRSYDWRWLDVECNLPILKYSFICEYAPPAPRAGAHLDGEAVLTRTVESDRSTLATAMSSSHSTTDDLDRVPSVDTDDISSSANELDEEVYVYPPPPAAAADGELHEEGSAPQLSYLAIGGVLLLAVVGALLLALFPFRRSRGRFAWLKAAASSAAGLSSAGAKEKKLSSCESADDVKSSLLNVAASLTDRLVDGQQQQPLSSEHASPNVYVDVGFACRRAGGPDGRISSADEPVYAKLVEPVP